jgi:hypothetical protein
LHHCSIQIEAVSRASHSSLDQLLREGVIRYSQRFCGSLSGNPSFLFLFVMNSPFIKLIQILQVPQSVPFVCQKHW